MFYEMALIMIKTSLFLSTGKTGLHSSKAMHFRRLGTPLLFLLLITHGLLPGVSAAQPVDGYLVVMSAFEPELTRLLDQADIQRREHIDGHARRPKADFEPAMFKVCFRPSSMPISDPPILD